MISSVHLTSLQRRLTSLNIPSGSPKRSWQPRQRRKYTTALNPSLHGRARRRHIHQSRASSSSIQLSWRNSAETPHYPPASHDVNSSLQMSKTATTTSFITFLQYRMMKTETTYKSNNNSMSVGGPVANMNNSTSIMISPSSYKDTASSKDTHSIVYAPPSQTMLASGP